MSSLGLIIILSLVEQIALTGILELKMKTFNNPSHRIPQGRCCDTILSPCKKNRCDNYFKKICLTAPSGTNCDIGNTATGVIQENSDSITFGSTIDRLSNPIVYTFAKWEGSFKLDIEIWDKDTVHWKHGDDLILRGQKTIVIPASREKNVTISKEVKISNRYSVLVLEVRVYCDEGYLLPSCEEYCTFTNNSSGHYSCDLITGNKLCFDGWYGVDCNKYCVPQDDEVGHYTCNNATGEIICMPGWRNERANCTDGSTINTKMHQTTTKLDLPVNPSYSLKTDVLVGFSTVSLYKPVQRTADPSPMHISSTPDSTSTTWLVNSKIHTTVNNYKTETTNIDVKMTPTMMTNSGKDVEFISTSYKATFYNNLMDATSLDYIIRTDATILEMVTSSSSEKTMHSHDATVSNNPIMNTTIYNNNQLVATSHIKMVRMSESLLSAKQTEWSLVQSSESSRTVKLNESATLGQFLSKAASNSVDLDHSANVLEGTSTLYWDRKIHGSTIDPKYIKVTPSSGASEYFPSSSFREPRYKLEEFRVRMNIEVASNEWNTKIKEMFKKELCLSIRNTCKYDFGCDMSNSSVQPEFTFKKKEGAKNLVTASFKFTEAVKAEDRKGMTKRPNVVNMNLYNVPLVTSKDDSDAVKCFQKAIINASKKIGGLMQLKITSVVFDKEQGEEPKIDNNPESQADGHENSDITKLLASFVIGSVSLIMIFLIGKWWFYQRRSPQQVQPSQLFMKNDTAMNRRFYGAKEFETNEHSINNRQGMIGEYKGIQLKTPNISGNCPKEILSETDEKHLETFFL